MQDFLLKIKFLKNNELVEGVAVEMFSPTSFKVFLEGDTTLGRHPALYDVYWDSDSDVWKVKS